MLLTIIASIFVFSVLVVIHELGHFLAAKWMGVRVEKFSIGFPPTIYSKKIGETEFSISAIPLGGYVKMAGFIDESMDTNVTGAPDEFNSKPVWRRIVIITAGVVMNLFLAVFIMSALNYSQGEQILPYTIVGQVNEGGVSERVGFVQGDKILSINGQSINNWNEITEAFIDNLNQDIRFDIIRDGNSKTLLYDKEWFKEKEGEQLDLIPQIGSIVGELSSDMPARELGLMTGDLITELDGQPVSDWLGMTEVIRKNPDNAISIKWERNGQKLSGMITPQSFSEKSSNGEEIQVGKIGISFYLEYREIGPGQAVINGVENTYKMIALNMRGLWWVISGTKSASEIIGGPIAIAKMAGEAADAGWVKLWYLIAVLSAVLAFFNILPIPALDGGHLFFLIIEGIIRKPLSSKAKIKFQQIGMAILLTFIILILYVDLKRILF